MLSRFFPALMAAAFVLAACDDQKPTSPLPTTAAAINGSVAARRPYIAFVDSLGTASGSIVIQGSADRKAILVGIDTVPQNGSVDKLFVLQSESVLDAPDLSEFAGRISYRNRFVRVTSASGIVLALRIGSDRPLPDEIQADALTLKGFGIVRRNGAYALAGGRMNTSDINRVFSLSCNRPALFHFSLRPLDPPCSAGGPGSSQCGINCNQPPGDPGWFIPSCSTSCGDGYYACCNCLVGGADCTCKRNRVASADERSEPSFVELNGLRQEWPLSGA